MNNTSHLLSFTDESGSTLSGNLEFGGENVSSCDSFNLEFGGENVSSCDSDSGEENEIVTLQSQERIINRASTMAHIASQSFSKVQSPLFANKHPWINTPSMLLLFSHKECHGRSEYFGGEKKLDEIVSNYGLSECQFLVMVTAASLLCH